MRRKKEKKKLVHTRLVYVPYFEKGITITTKSLTFVIVTSGEHLENPARLRAMVRESDVVSLADAGFLGRHNILAKSLLHLCKVFAVRASMMNVYHEFVSGVETLHSEVAELTGKHFDLKNIITYLKDKFAHVKELCSGANYKLFKDA